MPTDSPTARRPEEDRDPRSSPPFFQATLDALTAHIAVLDETGTILAVNAAWRRFAAANGLTSPGDGVGSNYLAVAAAATGPDADVGQATAAGIRAVLAGAQAAFSLEYPCHSPTQASWFIVRVTRMGTPEGPRAVVAHENITARKQAELERTAFLDAVTHDVKTPLTVAKGHTQLLRRRLRRAGTDHALLEGDVATIAAAIDRAVSLIDDLLDAAHLRAGRALALHLAPVDLVALAEDAAAELGSATTRHAVRVEAAVPTLVGTWDETRLRRILENLIGNAIKYSPRGGQIVVELRRDGEGTGAWAVLSVRDQGIGILAVDLPHLFARFHRGENVATIGGTGIGLAGTKQIVEQHRGTIAVESTEGVGSTFNVRLSLRLSGAGDR